MDGIFGARGWGGSIRLLFLVAIAVYLVTIAIGILNGLDVVEFSRDTLLTHVHSGTLGWVTLTIVAATAWFARGIDRRLAWSLAVLIPVYVALFFIGWAPGRAISGVVLLVAIFALLGWAWQVERRERSLPALALALGLTTFTYGAVIGVLRQVQLAGGPNLFPEGSDVVGAHGAAMVFSYLVLAAMGLLEWRLLGTRTLPRGGVVQIGALFLGGLIVSGTLLFLPEDAQQPAGGLYLLVELIAVVLFAIRIVPTALRRAMEDAASMYLAAAAVFVVVATGLFLFFVARLISDPTLQATEPPLAGILLSSDHSAFIGVITNLMLALLLRLPRGVNTVELPERLAFWGVNLGLVVFIVGLVLDEVLLKRIGAPLMGLALLLALALAAQRLRTATIGETEGTGAT